MGEKPSQHEEEYFARREAELLRQRKDTARTAAVNAERQSHFMKCPKCGYDLVAGVFEGVEIDQCTNCHGIWFDKGEAQSLLARDAESPISAVLKHLLGGLGGRPRP